MGAAHNHPPPAQTVAMQVLDAVAAHANADPIDLPRLYEVIDPEALDTIIATLDDGEVSFSYAGYAVTVDSGGAIKVSDAGSVE